LGLNTRSYSTHSLRIGGATELRNAGADRLVIKLMGRWLSIAFEDFPVRTAGGSSKLSNLMCGAILLKQCIPEPRLGGVVGAHHPTPELRSQ
ncbi:hypothetical protein JG688_00006439, partial [Phytophthora aleatoria]